MLSVKSAGVFMHDIDHHFVFTRLAHFENFVFTRLASIPSCSTRAAASCKFHVIHSWTKQHNQSFYRLEAMEVELLKSKPKQSFKRHLQTELLQFLVHEGVYVHNLADKF